MIIAIDGPAGVGKSTISRKLSDDNDCILYVHVKVQYENDLLLYDCEAPVGVDVEYVYVGVLEN